MGMSHGRVIIIIMIHAFPNIPKLAKRGAMQLSQTLWHQTSLYSELLGNYVGNQQFVARGDESTRISLNVSEKVVLDRGSIPWA